MNTISLSEIRLLARQLSQEADPAKVDSLLQSLEFILEQEEQLEGDSEPASLVANSVRYPVGSSNPMLFIAQEALILQGLYLNGVLVPLAGVNVGGMSLIPGSIRLGRQQYNHPLELRGKTIEKGQSLHLDLRNVHTQEITVSATWLALKPVYTMGLSNPDALTIDINAQVLRVDTSVSPREVNLPPVDTMRGKQVVVSAIGEEALIIHTSGAELIEGAVYRVLPAGQNVRLLAPLKTDDAQHNMNWWIL